MRRKRGGGKPKPIKEPSTTHLKQNLPQLHIRQLLSQTLPPRPGRKDQPIRQLHLPQPFRLHINPPPRLKNFRVLAKSIFIPYYRYRCPAHFRPRWDFHPADDVVAVGNFAHQPHTWREEAQAFLYASL